MYIIHQEQSHQFYHERISLGLCVLRYVISVIPKQSHILIVRTGLFTLCSSALLSLLPFLAKHELGLDSTRFWPAIRIFWYGCSNWWNSDIAKIKIYGFGRISYFMFNIVACTCNVLSWLCA